MTSDTQSVKTPDARTGAATDQEWHEVDARGQTLGRLASGIAQLLLGKHRYDSAPHLVSPVYVVVKNADFIHVTGDKKQSKLRYWYTGYPGGIRQRSLGEQLKRDSRKVIERAVGGMLPKNSLRKIRLQHLKVYPGPEHPHGPQINS